MMKCSKWLSTVVLFVFLLYVNHINATKIVNAVKKSKLNIGVIGAGPAGLVSVKQAIAHGHDVTVYEQNNELGGVWV